MTRPQGAAAMFAAAWALLSSAFILSGGGTHWGVSLSVGGLLVAGPALVVLWLVDQARRRREAASREAALAGPPRVVVLHALIVELPKTAAERLASEMDCGAGLARRAATALAAALPHVLRMSHRARSHVFDHDWREVIAREREARDHAGRGYRDSKPNALGPTRQVVWHLVAAYPDDPGPAPVLGSPELRAWLEAIVPAIPVRTQASEVHVRPVPAVAEEPE